jgi:Fe(3+) dicitrate transport protein
VVEIDSELSWNYEIGLRARPLASVSLESTYFRNDYENQIVPSSVAGGTGSTRTNAGATLQDGMELNGRFDSSLAFKTDHNFYIQTAYTFVRTAEFRSMRFSSVSGFGDVSVTGNRLPYVPKHLATSTIGFEYRGFHGFVENQYVSGQFSDDLNTFDPIESGQRGRIGSQMYLNATANYKVEKWKTTFFVTAKNIADRLAIVDRTRGIYPSSPRLIQTGFAVRF